MIPPHLFFQIYPSLPEPSAHTEVEDLSSRYMNWSNVCD